MLKTTGMTGMTAMTLRRVTVSAKIKIADNICRHVIGVRCMEKSDTTGDDLKLSWKLIFYPTLFNTSAFQVFFLCEFLLAKMTDS